MDLLQYSFTLAPGHAMQSIRERVAAKRELVRTLPGLRWKAWMISEPLPGRDQPKTYAPLYLFEDAPSVHAFLCGELYQGVTDAFGWTRPHHAHAIATGAADIAAARSCALTVSSLDDHGSLRRALAQACSPPQPPRGPAPAGTLLGTFSLLDAGRMAMRSYAFWTCEAQALAARGADLVYEVVDVSMPLPCC